MQRYLAKRLGEGVITIWMTTLVVFSLLRTTWDAIFSAD
jgi:hypothetical protein